MGELSKHEVRERALAMGLRTASKPDSQDVCFITASGGRRDFLGDRIALHPGRVVDTAGTEIGRVDAVELVTLGQRRGLGAAVGERSYAVDVDVAAATVTVGSADDLLTESQALDAITFVGPVISGRVLAQCSAHGVPRSAHSRRHDVDVGRAAAPSRAGAEHRVLRHGRHRAARRRHRRLTALDQVWARPRSTIFNLRRSTSAGSNPASRCQARASRRSTSHPSATVPATTPS